MLDGFHLIYYISFMDVKVGDILYNGCSQTVRVLGPPIMESDGRWVCKVIHIYGAYEGQIADKYYIGSDGLMSVDIISRIIIPKKSLKKFNFK